MEFNQSKNKEIEIDKNLAYFLGVLHSDGCIYVFNDKKENLKRIKLALDVGNRSIPMAMKFKNILFDYFGRKVNLRKKHTKNTYRLNTSINRIWYIFKRWYKYKVPKSITKNPYLFGAYLGGLIDGDGYVKIKHNIKNRVTPQCVIKIASNRSLKKIKDLIELHLDCNVHFEFDKNNKGVDTCFYVSKKNIDYVKTFVLPHMTIPHKIDSLNNFFQMKERAYPDLNRNSTVRSGVCYPGCTIGP